MINGAPVDQQKTSDNLDSRNVQLGIVTCTAPQSGARLEVVLIRKQANEAKGGKGSVTVSGKHKSVEAQTCLKEGRREGGRGARHREAHLHTHRGRGGQREKREALREMRVRGERNMQTFGGGTTILQCVNGQGHDCLLQAKLNCSEWADFHAYMSGLGLIYLAI
jgi:hypothetical protein